MCRGLGGAGVRLRDGALTTAAGAACRLPGADHHPRGLPAAGGGGGQPLAITYGGGGAQGGGPHRQHSGGRGQQGGYYQQGGQQQQQQQPAGPYGRPPPRGPAPPPVPVPRGIDPSVLASVGQANLPYGF